MTFFLRLVVILGTVFGVWRMLVRLQKRPDYLPAKDYIRSTDDIQRLLGFESIANLRDIGGYITQDGKIVKSGLVYRGASLAYVSDAEAQKLADLGIKLVCDLRTHEEISAAPDKVPDGATYWHLPVLQLNNRWQEAVRMVTIPHYLDGMTKQIYTNMVDHQTDLLAQLFRKWSAAESLPALVHCSAGKDRTGVSVALLLRVLGVTEEAVLADYSQTNTFFEYIQTLSTDLIAALRRLGLRQQDILPLLLANPDNLEFLLRHIDQKYGSVEGYFETALRFTAQDIARLRETFLG